MEMIQRVTPDITQENIERLTELFPQVATEVKDESGVVKPSVDFDALRDLLGDVAEGQRERYQFTWPGKSDAKLEARKPCDKTLRPHPEKSVDWGTTQNVYIEGDNLDALKVMRETYAGKVKLIYIDPPYNTGHDFIYDDNFAQTHEEYDAQSGDYDEEGGRLVANPEGNGRFHSDWCSMIYSRLLLARDLLSSDGAIFISIDDNESVNLRKICDEVFGAGNFLANFVWEKKYTRANDAQFYSTNHDFIVAYALNTLSFKAGRLPRTEKMNAAYTNPDDDPKGPWKATPLNARSGSSSGIYSHTFSNGTVWTPPSGTFPRYSEARLTEMEANGEIWFGKNGDAVPSRKTYLSSLEDKGIVATTIIPHELGGHNHEAEEEVKSLFGGVNAFSSPKPVRLLDLLLKFGNVESEDLVIDFFSGSATIAQAVMQCNALDAGNRNFILVQLPEPCELDSAAGKAGYKTICDIGEERIRRAGKKIAEEIEETNAQLKIGEDPKPVPDIGFRVFSIDSSNFLDTYSEPGEQTQSSLLSLVDNLKEDRTPDDLLFQVLPAFRIPYSARIEKIDVAGAACFNVNDGQLIACFDMPVSTDAIEEIAQMKPIYAVFRDASFASDSDAANFEELFKTYSPDTVRRVI